MPERISIGQLAIEATGGVCYNRSFTVNFPKGRSIIRPKAGCPGVLENCKPNMSCREAKNLIVHAMNSTFDGSTVTSGRGTWTDLSTGKKRLGGEDVWIVQSSHTCTIPKKLIKLNRNIMRAMFGTCQKAAFYRENGKLSTSLYKTLISRRSL